jgi:hypothetical protein
MNLHDAISVIESTSGFTDEDTPVGEAWAIVLAWINPTPVPVSERMPGAEDCDAEGMVWGIAEMNCWMLVHHSKIARWRAWLPYNALPIPRSEND